MSIKEQTAAREGAPAPETAPAPLTPAPAPETAPAAAADPHEPTDEALVQAAQAGDEAAEEYLIRKYKGMVKSKAHLYFMAGADAEDIVQEGMIGIFKAIRSFDSEKQASFRTFAELCVNRQIITAVKRATRLKHSPLNTSLSLNRPMPGGSGQKTLGETLFSGSGSDPEARLLMKEAMGYIERNEAKLFSNLERQVWSEYQRGRSYEEIARSVGKTPKAVDNAIQRTKKKLALYLDASQ